MGWGPFLGAIALLLIVGWAVLAYHRLWSLAVLARRSRDASLAGGDRHAAARYEHARQRFPTNLLASVAGFGPLEEQREAAASEEPPEETA